MSHRNSARPTRTVWIGMLVIVVLIVVVRVAFQRPIPPDELLARADAAIAGYVMYRGETVYVLDDDDLQSLREGLRSLEEPQWPLRSGTVWTKVLLQSEEGKDVVELRLSTSGNGPKVRVVWGSDLDRFSPITRTLDAGPLMGALSGTELGEVVRELLQR